MSISSSDIQMLPATREQEPIVAKLLELYAYDFSELMNMEFGPDGRFGYEHLPLYWADRDHYPFLVSIDGKWAGVILVKQGLEISGDKSTRDMAEFFVVRAHRRWGVGTAIAHQVWSRFPGSWEVRVMETNRAALYFWQRTITTFTGQTAQPALVQKNGSWKYLFSFQSAGSDAVGGG